VPRIIARTLLVCRASPSLAASVNGGVASSGGGVASVGGRRRRGAAGHRGGAQEDRQAAVAGRQGRVGQERHRGAPADHADHAVAVEAGALEDLAGGAGALEGQLPVGLVGAGRERRGVGVTLDLDRGLMGGQDRDQLDQEVAQRRLERRRRGLEQHAVVAVVDLDQDALGRGHDPDLARDLGQVDVVVGHGADLLLHRARLVIEGLLAMRWRHARLLHDRRDVGRAAVHRQLGVGQDAGAEVVGDLLARLGVGRRQEPEHHEQRHHRGDEVGVGDLPGPAVVAVATDLLDDLATRWLRRGRHDQLPFKDCMALSASENDGRSS
jgi:hypothetical protein